MDVERIQWSYPEVDREELYPHFPRLATDAYPELDGDSWEDCHAGAMGPGGLFLAADMARTMALRPGRRVLDLGPGHGATSIFLAKRHGLQVVAADLWIDPTEIGRRAARAGAGDAVLAIRAEAHDLPFAHESFDAIFCMDAYHYFGTGDLYLPYILRFLRPGGVLAIAGPCYAEELTPDTPREFLHDESLAWHSPGWWDRHLTRTGLVDVRHSSEHPAGRELWLDWVRWRLEERHPRERLDWTGADLLQDIVMLLSDDRRFLTHFLLTVTRG